MDNIKELVRAQYAFITLWMHTEGLENTREAESIAR